MDQPTENSLDYDLIHAPQFVDFQKLHNIDPQDGDDTAHSFFQKDQEEAVLIDHETGTIQDSQNTDTAEDKVETDLPHDQNLDIFATKEIELLQTLPNVDSYGENDALGQDNQGQEGSCVAGTGESELSQQGKIKDNASGEMVPEELTSVVGIVISQFENKGSSEQGNSVSEAILGSPYPILTPDNLDLNIDMITAEVAALAISEPPATIPNALAKTAKTPSEAMAAIQSRMSVLIPKKLDIKTTVPKPFHFHSVRQRNYAAPVEQNDGYTFKARPVPLKVYRCAPTFKSQQAVKVTIPLSPHFASDDRIRERQLRVATTTPGRQLVDATTTPGRQLRLATTTPGRHAQAGRSKENEDPMVPLTGAMAVDSSRRRYRSMTPVSRGRSPSPAQRTTIIQPFSFEEREKERKRARDEKIRNEEDEEAKRHEFHANPFPTFKFSLPKKRIFPATKAEPFQLKVDERGTKHQELFRKKLEGELRLRKEKATFYANPPTVIFKEPFEPEKSQKPLTEPWDIELNSDRRAQERGLFELQMKGRELMEEERRQQEEAVRLAQEGIQAQELRKKLVHKPQPMRGLRAFELKQSSKPLTTPMSPAFAPLPSQRRTLHQLHTNNEQ